MIIFIYRINSELINIFAYDSKSVGKYYTILRELYNYQHEKTKYFYIEIGIVVFV